MEPLLFTLDESAKQLSVSPRTVRRMMERGELPWVRIGRAIRIPGESIKKWIDMNMSTEHNQTCAGNVQGGKSTCQKEKTRTDSINARIHPTGGRVTPTQAARELAVVVGLETAKKRKDC